MPDLVVVLTTVPSQEAGETIARALVDQRLAACVNVLPAMTSIYRWNGAVHSDTEHQLVIKTARPLVGALRELLVLTVADGDPAYLAWVLQETSGEDR